MPFDNPLKKGSTSPHVAAMQRQLLALGYDLNRALDDGGAKFTTGTGLMIPEAWDPTYLGNHY